ncbi:DUF4334 domain-containing protein [Skermania sp. ID1734]|uniref:DUF4334 domain-containing protein n=1 Tax=Skermania sp. ID1734 TaxID=2597516 RepID=UPI00117E2D73|nr:DUF4334 domain-containing protein [Skermania sp. ID1734]TSD94603.1 DUF4334 domain-containing protein [Skermania sp. ID1734]
MTADTNLADLESGCTAEDALALFDSLPAVRAEDITGRWKGRELRTGHPMDGMLSASGWYGKQFDDVNSVHPLLFSAGDKIFAVDPRKVPLGLADKLDPGLVEKGQRFLGLVEPALRTSKPRARLRNLEHRGVVTAAMVYDHLPIIDIFRRVDDDTLLGVMDQRGMDAPYFFILARD